MFKDQNDLSELSRHATAVFMWISDLQMFDDDLCGACAIASYVLCQRLEMSGFRPTFMCGSFSSKAPSKFNDGSHCWVQVDDHCIDVTCKQFGSTFPDVLLVKKKVYKARIARYMDNTWTDSDAYDVVSRWDDQSPFYDYVRFEIDKHLNDFIKSEAREGMTAA